MDAKTASNLLLFPEGISFFFRRTPVFLFKNCLKAYTNAIIKSSKNGKKILYRTGRISIAFYLTKFIAAISERIISYYGCARGSVLVRIDKPADHRVIVAALQVVEACFGIVLVSTVLQRIDICQTTAGGDDLTLGVVLAGGQHVAIDILNAGNVALLSGHVIASYVRPCSGMVSEANGSVGLIIEEEHLVAIPFLPNQLVTGIGVMVCGAVHRFCRAKACPVIGVGHIGSAGTSFS